MLCSHILKGAYIHNYSRTITSLCPKNKQYPQLLLSVYGNKKKRNIECVNFATLHHKDESGNTSLSTYTDKLINSQTID